LAVAALLFLPEREPLLSLHVFDHSIGAASILDLQ
jgi:hypothetical protein